MTNSNDPAYPEILELAELSKNGGDVRYYRGLTKREYFAAMAMCGLAMKPNEKGEVELPFVVAELAKRYADALIAALTKAQEVKREF
jgi:hypothetical protein